MQPTFTHVPPRPATALRNQFTACITILQRKRATIITNITEEEISLLSLLSSCGWTNNKFDITDPQEKKKEILICAHEGFIEMGPKK